MEGKFITHTNIILCLFAQLTLVSAGHLGIGISLPERGGTMVDQVHEHYRFSKAGGGDLTKNDVDSSGWPIVDCRYVKDWRPVAEWWNDIDDPERYRVDVSGLYKCSFSGQATLSNLGVDYAISNQTYDTLTNKTTFDLAIDEPGPGHGLLILEFLDTKRTLEGEDGTGITNFRMTRPNYNHDSEQIFTDAFLNTLTSADFSTIRFMDFRHTNNSEPNYPAVIEWEHRKKPTDAGQGQIPPLGKLDGAAWEYVVELGNEVQMDIWINIQIAATTDYVEKLAKLIKNTLDPELNIYIESSNEVWNNIFNQYNYNIAQANHLGIGEHENHARRTIELAQIFESVFGEGSLNQRVRLVLCSHAPMLKWWVQPMLNYVNTNFGSPNDYIYAIARQTYFEASDRSGSVSELLDGCQTEIDKQITETSGNESGRRQWVQAAASWGFAGGLCSYEGGFHVPSGGSTDNLANQIKMHRNQRAANVLKYNYDEAFFTLGGNLAMQFTLTSGYNRYGCWGLTDDVNYPDRNYKFQAVRELIEKQTNINTEKNYIPKNIKIFQCYPNPFNPQTNIRFELPDTRVVRIDIYNIFGQHISTLTNQKYASGLHEVYWNGFNMQNMSVNSGVYYCMINAGPERLVRKLTLLR